MNKTLRDLPYGVQLTGENLLEALGLLTKEELIEIISQAINVHFGKKGLRVFWQAVDDNLVHWDRKRYEQFLSIELNEPD
jgi:hypothetical protein